MNNINIENKTVKRLIKAYTELLLENDYDKITVGKIVDRAYMSRATFYLHFESYEAFVSFCKDYVMDVLINQLIHWFAEGSNNVSESVKRKNLIMSSDDILLFREHFRQKLIFNSHDEFEFFCEKFFGYFEKRFSVEFVNENRKKLEFFLRAYIICSMDSIFDYSYKREEKELNSIFKIWKCLFPDIVL